MYTSGTSWVSGGSAELNGVFACTYSTCEAFVYTRYTVLYFRLTPQSLQDITSEFLFALAMHTLHSVWPHWSRNGSLFTCLPPSITTNSMCIHAWSQTAPEHCNVSGFYLQAGNFADSFCTLLPDALPSSTARFSELHRISTPSLRAHAHTPSYVSS